MTSYTKTTDFEVKDTLLTGNPSKVIKGQEIDDEFDAVQAADADNVKISGLATGVNTFLTTPSSANLAAAVTDETGSGALVFATSPTLVTPALGTPASGTLDNCTTNTEAAGTNNTQLANTAHVFAERTNTATLTNKTLTTPVLTNPSFSGTTSDMGTVTTIDINGGTIDGAVIGGTSAAAGTFTTLTSNGNTTLGDASTDTVTVNGYVGVGGAPSSQFGTSVTSSALTGTSQRAFRAGITATSAATTSVIGYSSSLSTAATVFTVADMMGFYAFDNVAGATSTITNNHGLYVANQTAGTNNYGITLLVSAGANKRAINSTGTAASVFSGDLKINGAGGLGYDTGSGGTVTQATSRTTGVTINKTNGAITLVSAAGSTSWQSFTVTNSTIAATDTIIVNQKSGTDLNMIEVTAVAAGSFRISFATTGGTTVEQPVFNFSVIKAVTA